MVTYAWVHESRVDPAPRHRAGTHATSARPDTDRGGATISRRNLFRGAGVGAGAVVATAVAASAAAGSEAGRSRQWITLGSASRVKVGKAWNFKSAYVVAQPTRGEYRGFIARCPHQACAQGYVGLNRVACRQDPDAGQGR